jgi:hypothetical protein
VKEELEKQLFEKYPKLFSNRENLRSPLCYGIECGDGWFNLIDITCKQIQNYIDWQRESFASTKQYNRIYSQAKKGNERNLRYYCKNKLGYKTQEEIDEYVKKAKPRETFKEEVVKQVSFFQVKEKFAQLCIYTNGADDHISGIIRMAEAISACTCEDCGFPGKVRKGGWIRTLCDTCADKKGKK